MALRRNLMKVAVEEAGRSLRSFGVNYTEPIDVFKIIHNNDIELLFRPLLGQADGFYIPPRGKQKAGVLLNSRRPLSRRRYTAAHELCHFMRKDSARIRVETILENFCAVRQGASEDEMLADFFAAHFLMPSRLIVHYYKVLGLRAGPLAPPEVYKLSLCMGTSYSATCNQLANLEFITRDNFERLSKVQPRQIKAQWAKELGHRDVWPINHKMNGLIIIPQVEDTIRVLLPETPSSGYLWHYAAPEGSILTFESASLHLPDSNEFIGQTGNREMIFRVHAPGRDTLKVRLMRPWEREECAIEAFSLHVVSSQREFNGHYSFLSLAA